MVRGLTFEFGRILLRFAEIQRAAPFVPVRTQLVFIVDTDGPAVIAADAHVEPVQDQPGLFILLEFPAVIRTNQVERRHVQGGEAERLATIFPDAQMRTDRKSVV